MDVKEIASAVDFVLPKGVPVGQENFALLQHIASLSEEEQVALPSAVKDWFNFEVDNWDKYQAEAVELAGKAGQAAAKEVTSGQGVAAANPVLEPQETQAQEEASKVAATEPTPEDKGVVGVEELNALTADDTQKEKKKEKKEKAPQTSRKGPRVLKPGTYIHSFLAVLNAEPASTRDVLIPKMIEHLKKHKAGVDDVKATRTFQAYISTALNPTYAHEAGVLCEKNEEKEIVIKQYPFPRVVQEKAEEASA